MGAYWCPGQSWSMNLWDVEKKYTSKLESYWAHIFYFVFWWISFTFYEVVSANIDFNATHVSWKLFVSIREWFESRSSLVMCWVNPKIRISVFRVLVSSIEEWIEHFLQFFGHYLAWFFTTFFQFQYLTNSTFQSEAGSH